MSTRPRPDRAWDRGSDALGAALTFAVAVALFAWLGFLADGRLGTAPLFLIVGLALGLVGGFLHVLRVLAPDLLPTAHGRRKGASARGPAAGDGPPTERGDPDRVGPPVPPDSSGSSSPRPPSSGAGPAEH